MEGIEETGAAGTRPRASPSLPRLHLRTCCQLARWRVEMMVKLPVELTVAVSEGGRDSRIGNTCVD